jgi:predicted enzyme related to lactoylglutathione lyase
MVEPTSGKVTNVMLDTDDLNGAVGFWSTLLDLEITYRDETYAFLGRLASDGPSLGIQLVPEPKAGKNRMHLDVMVEDRDAFAEWVVELGGRLIEEHDHPSGQSWVVMADPQGNEFCIYEKPEDAA